jgi:hypothetical protein
LQKLGVPRVTNNLHTFLGLPLVAAPPPPAPLVLQPSLMVQPVEVPTCPGTEWQHEVLQQQEMDAGLGTDAINTESQKKGKGRGKNSRSGLLKECMKKIDLKYLKEAIKMVKSGELWDNLKIVLHHQMGIDMRKSWKDFHKLRIFNWFRLEMLPSFKPKCGTCGNGDHMIKDGMNNPPHLIFAEFENYILNAPQRLCCSRCKSMAATQKAKKIPKNEQVQYFWLTTEECILEQLACEEPDMFEQFPCYLSAKAGLDKECFNNIVDKAPRIGKTLEQNTSKGWGLNINDNSGAEHQRKHAIGAATLKMVAVPLFFLFFSFSLLFFFSSFLFLFFSFLFLFFSFLFFSFLFFSFLFFFPFSLFKLAPANTKILPSRVLDFSMIRKSLWTIFLTAGVAGLAGLAGWLLEFPSFSVCYLTHLTQLIRAQTSQSCLSFEELRPRTCLGFDPSDSVDWSSDSQSWISFEELRLHICLGQQWLSRRVRRRRHWNMSLDLVMITILLRCSRRTSNIDTIMDLMVLRIDDLRLYTLLHR